MKAGYVEISMNRIDGGGFDNKLRMEKTKGCDAVVLSVRDSAASSPIILRAIQVFVPNRRQCLLICRFGRRLDSARFRVEAVDSSVTGEIA